MKVYELTGGFGLDHLVQVEREVPVPGPSEVLIKMRAVSLNRRDLAVIDGFFNPDLKDQFIPISDGVGEIVALGEQATKFKLGDRVSGQINQSWISGGPTKENSTNQLGSPLDGLLTEYAVLPEHGLVLVPEHLTDEEAATLPIVGVTAWHGLVEEGKVKAGDTVVVQGTGNISLFALQFAKLHGASVIATSSSDEKLVRAKSLGADYGINYNQTPDWDKLVLERTNGRGADHIVDVGGAATLNRSISAIRMGGQISSIGFVSGPSVENFDVIPAFVKKVRIQGIDLGSREMFENMNRAIQQNKLRPVVDIVYSFEQAIDALQHMAKGAYFGKICIKF